MDRPDAPLRRDVEESRPGASLDGTVRLWPGRTLRRLIGASAIGFSTLYLLSDLIELVQGGFSVPQLWLTYLAEAAVPFYVLGLWLVQQPPLGRLGSLGAIGFAYTFVFFPGTVLFALVEGLDDWSALQERLGLWLTVHGVLMVLSGACLGWGVARAGVLPAWTGYALMAAMVLVAIASGMGDLARTGAAGLRDIAFIGMGLSLLRPPRHSREELG